MRDPNRINPFLEEIGKLWKTECPDQRFTQFIFNVFDGIGGPIYYMEDEDTLRHFKNYFNKGEEQK